MSAQDLDPVVSAARQAFEEWSSASLEQRTHVLNRFADQLRERHTRLLQTISQETHKPRWEARIEVDAMISKIALTIQSHARRQPIAESTAENVTSATRYRPHGVLAVLGPFNFPGHLPNGHIAPALLAGNPCVFKPSEHTPQTADLMLECWRDAELPKGVLQVVHGGREMGETLVHHHDVDGVLFTGSLAAGRAINRALADTPGKIVALEMGGNNPLVVANVNSVRAAAYATIQSAYITAGQRCSCARRLIVVDGASGEDFIKTLLGMMKRIQVGFPSDIPQPFMGPVISDHAARQLLVAQQKLIDNGAIALAPLESLRGQTSLLSPALLDVTNVRERSDEEFFGPLLQLIRVKTFDDAIAEANNSQFGLCAGLLSDVRELYDRFYAKVRAGVVNWNRPLTGASSALPFGGVKNSGNHRPSGAFAIDYCAYPVASMETSALVMPDKPTPGIDL